MTSTPSFNLIEQPWIRVRTIDGDVAERSLRDVLVESPRLRGLAGEIPTQDAAVLRLLLAVILGATRPGFPRSERECIDLFEDWWERGEVPAEILDPYLARIYERFDLLHPKVPFMQVAGLTTASGNHSGLGKLIADLPPNQLFFTTRGGSELNSMSMAEAARWLVHCQAFDPAGIKTGAIGDDRVKGGKGYSLGYSAWAGNLGLVLAVGGTLFETLLFNTPWLMSGPDDLPIWERAQLGPAVDVEHPTPNGPADLFTWPSRRMRLFLSDDRVVDVQISNGDRLGPQNLHPYESMTAWRRSKSQSKAGAPVQMPTTHDSTRRIWQGLGPLLQRAKDGSTQPAPVVVWLDRLKNDEALPRERLVDLRILGIEYGTQNAVISGSIDDRLTATVATLTDPTLVQTAVDAVAQAKDGVVALANLAGNLDRAAGGEGQARERTFEIGYGLLDPCYRMWVRTLKEPGDAPHYRAVWATTASEVLRKAGEALVADAGPAALVGRQVGRSGTDSTQLLDAGLAHLWFRAALTKSFPPTEPEPNRGNQ